MHKDLCVLIPAYKEELLIGRCIQSVLEAGISIDDVYVVDDCSPDRTSDEAARFAGIHILRNERNVGKAAGLLALIQRFDIAGRYRYAAVLDGDSHVGREYFDVMLARCHAEPDAVVVCGGPESIRHNWITAGRALEYLNLRHVHRKGQSRLGVIPIASGCACVYDTRIFEKLDWLGGTEADDIDTTVQIHRAGLGRIVFEPRAVVHTQDPSTLSEYRSQIRRWYAGFWQSMLRHRLPLGGQRIDAEYAVTAAESLLLALVVALAPLWAVLDWKLCLWALAADQTVAIAAAAVFSAIARRWDILLYSPLFIVMRILNNLTILSTFWTVVVRRRAPRKWYSVARYAPPVLAVGLLGSGIVPARADEAPPQPPSDLMAPGNAWNYSGPTSPMERGNVLQHTHAEQGLTPWRSGRAFAVVYIAADDDRDSDGYDWNNKLQGSVGVKVVQTFRHGMVRASATYASERRSQSHLERHGLLASAETACSWSIPTGAATAGFRPRLPGNAYAAVGQFSAIERGNTLAIADVTQGVSVFSRRRLDVTPYLNATLMRDSARNDWGNRETAAAGLRVSIAAGPGTFEAGVARRFEHRPVSDESASATIWFASIGLGWSPMLSHVRP